MDTTQLSFLAPVAMRTNDPADPALTDAPEGMTFVPDVIDTGAERALLFSIDGQPWTTSMSRRVQHYGWRYDYKSRRVSPDAYLGPLPPFLDSLVALLQENYGFRPDQAIVNEYVPGQGIAPHVDCEPCFGPQVAMVGLGSATQMDFAHREDGRTWHLRFAPRGLLLLTGPARYEWTHAIAKRRLDRVVGVERDRRVSVTFRTVTSAPAHR